MKLETLQSYSRVVITVHRKGHGMIPGVYTVGEDVSHVKAVALLNDKKAKLLVAETEPNEPILSRKHIEKEPVSAVDGGETGDTKSPKTRRKRSGRRKKSKTAKTGGETISDNLPISGNDGLGGGTEDTKENNKDPWLEGDSLDINLEG